jgi:hypothetical protein
MRDKPAFQPSISTQNRQTQEAHYVNMLKLRRDMHRARCVRQIFSSSQPKLPTHIHSPTPSREILQLIKSREEAKRKLLDLEQEAFFARAQAADWDGSKQQTLMPWIPKIKAPTNPALWAHHHGGGGGAAGGGAPQQQSLKVRIPLKVIPSKSIQPEELDYSKALPPKPKKKRVSTTAVTPKVRKGKGGGGG